MPEFSSRVVKEGACCNFIFWLPPHDADSKICGIRRGTDKSVLPQELLCGLPAAAPPGVMCC